MERTKKSTALITGGNTGIGLEVGKQLAWKGYRVILACRSQERGLEAVENIKQLFPKSDVTFMKLDLSSLSSVREFVEAFRDTNSKLDILINNAGVCMGEDRQVTDDGLEITMTTNHLGHFLMTNLLLDILKNTARSHGEARIVNVTSSLHNSKNKSGGFSVNTADPLLQKEGAYNGKMAYANSKLCNVLFTYELARRLDGCGVTVNCLCPGFIPHSSLKRHTATGWWKAFFMEYILYYLLRPFGMTKTIQEALTPSCKSLLAMN